MSWILAAALAINWSAINPGHGIEKPDLWITAGGLCSTFRVNKTGDHPVYEWKNYSISNWVPAWDGFAIASDDSLYSLNPETGDVVYRSAIAPDPDYSSCQWSVSPDGKLLAEFDQSDVQSQVLTIRRVDTGKWLLSLDRSGLTKGLGARAREITTDHGIAWSPKGDHLAISHAFGAEIDNGGVAVARLAVYDLKTKKFRNWGEGKPSAWISGSKILVEDGRGVRVIDQSRRAAWKPGPDDCLTYPGWDGVAIVLFTCSDKMEDNRRWVERWTPDLKKRISKKLLPSVASIDLSSGAFVAPRNR